tara:strand:- start:2461 stop:4302 length:1842 start_codon:yes stop_codon:yes gene_type:complete
MSIDDTYKGLSRRTQRRRERRDLEALGTTGLLYGIKEINKNLKEANEDFIRGNENVMQQMINYSDAEETSGRYQAEIDEAKSLNLSIGDYLVNKSAEMKEAEMIAQLGANARNFYTKSWARDLAEQDREELVRLHTEGRMHGLTTDWDKADFEDFIKLNDGRSDNVGSAIFNVMTSPFRKNTPEITGDMLAKRLEESEFGRSASAMNAYRLALTNKLGIDDALDLADKVLNSEYKISDKVTKAVPLKDTFGLGEAYTLTYTKPDGSEYQRVLFGTVRTNKEGDLQFTPNPDTTSQEIYDSNQITIENTTNVDLNGVPAVRRTQQIVDPSGQVIAETTGKLMLSGDFTAYNEEGEMPSEQRLGETATRTELNTFTNNLTQSLTAAFADTSIRPHKIEEVKNAFLGITEMAGDQELTAEQRNAINEGFHRAGVGLAKSLKIRGGFTDTDAVNLASAMLAQEIKSGAEYDDGFLGFSVGFSEYNPAKQISMRGENAGALHLLHAYVAMEASPRPITINNSNFINVLKTGSVGIEYNAENQEEFDTVRNRQQQDGVYMPNLIESLINPNNRNLLNLMQKEVNENSRYRESLMDVLDQAGPQFKDQNGEVDLGKLFRS